MAPENRNTQEYVYELYEQFIKHCLLNDNSVLTSESGIFTIQNLFKVKSYFLDAAIEGSGPSYWDKIKQQFQDANYEERLCFAHLNWLWYLPANDITSKTKEETPYWILESEEFKDRFTTNKNSDYFPHTGVGSAGQYHKTNKPMEINFLLVLCILIKEEVGKGNIKTTDDVNNYIVENATTVFDTNTFNIPEHIYTVLQKRAFSMQSLMMHLAKPSYYEAIASNQHKAAIKLSFQGLLEDADYTKKDITIDDEIHHIKLALEKLGVGGNFYSDRLWPIWNKGLHNVSEDLMVLQYKKAMIYYGPPGTGKTYSAKKLAEAFITNHYLHKKENLKKYFEIGLENIESRIHNLQFNPNTSYEDFIAGYQLKATQSGSETVPVRGLLFDVIEKANNETQTTDKHNKVKLPHVLILDEINRVDLSRVFGELFSAMEYRNKPIQTAIKGIELSIPENLYIIGTMNEIDFSVERMDFALRRRFVWKFKGYDEDALREMLVNDHDRFESNREIFISCCTALNRYISSEIEELGESYEIGHAFFAELSTVYKEHYNLVGKGRSRNKLFRESRDILWNISIAPILEAFLGNTDKASVRGYMEIAEKLFHGK